MGGRFVVRFSNSSVDAANYQICDHDFSIVGLATDEEITAQVIAFWQQAGFNMCAVGTVIESIAKYPTTGGGGTPMPFPVTEHAALVVADPTLPAATAYPVDVGSGASPLAPLGTSIVVSEYTATPGPGGRGRFYSPFIAVGAVDTAGFVKTTIRATVASLYEKWFMDSPPDPGIIGLLPEIVHSGGGASSIVTHVAVQPVFSNLESRRR